MRRHLNRRWQLAAGLLPAIAWLLTPVVAAAHGGQPLAPHDLWGAWSWDVLTAGPILLLAVAYGLGLRRLWRSAGRGRGLAPWRAVSFAGALLALFIALISPLAAMSGVLFSAHMVQHLLLMMAAAPLLVLARPELILLWALPQAKRQALLRWQHRQRAWRGLWSLLRRPAVVWLLYAFGFWLWHTPALYQAALRSEFIHGLEHATFFGISVLFWWTLRNARLRGEGFSYGSAVLFVFTTALHGGLLGWLLTFTTQLWYPAYSGLTAAWGLSALEDQQLAGAIMWAPAGMVYAVAALLLLQKWLARLERQGAGQREVIRPPRNGAQNGRVDLT